MSQSRYAILGMLTIAPMSGYDLKKFSEKSLAHFWNESYGTLYPRLAELEQEGLVSGRQEQRERAPDATVYRITAKGRRVLAAWLDEPASPERTRSELLLKVFFGAEAPVDATIEQIIAYRDQQEAMRHTFAAIEAHLRSEMQTTRNAAFRLLTLRRGQLLVDARLRWCDEALETLRTLDHAPRGAAQCIA